MKRCSQCGETKPLAEFPPAKKVSDGRSSWCRPCKRIKGMEDHWRHRAERLVKQKAYRAAHKAETAEANRRYRAEHREELRVKKRAQYARRRDEIIARTSAWRKANPQLRREYQMRRRVRTHGVDVAPVDREAIYERDHGICHLCDQPVPRDHFSLDHLIPVSLGGEHSPENVAIAHPVCNTRRRTMSVEEARKLLSP